MVSFRYLVSQGANIEVRGGILSATPILWAVRGGHLNSVVELIKAGANLHAIDKNGSDVFMTAACENKPAILAYLLAKGAIYYPR